MAAFEPETPAEAFVLDNFRSRVWKPLQDIYEEKWDQGMCVHVAALMAGQNC